MLKVDIKILGKFFVPRTPPFNYSVEITLIKTLAILMVLLFYASSHYLYENRSWSFGWWQAIIFEVICRPCVPWFFMVTGCLLMKYEKSAVISNFYKRRLNRIILPFIFWSFLYLAWENLTAAKTTLIISLPLQIIEVPVY